MSARICTAAFVFACACVFARAAQAQHKPFTQDQVMDLVRAGIGDETGAHTVQQRGIDFEPTDEFLQKLKAAGANETFVQALRAMQHPHSAASTEAKPITQLKLLSLLAGEVSNQRIAVLIGERGIDFVPDANLLDQVRAAGGDDEVVSALKSATLVRMAKTDAAAEANQAEIQQHMARGGEYFESRRFPQAEAEFREAVRLDPQNVDFQVALARALYRQNKNDEGMVVSREALRLNPQSDMAHYAVGTGLTNKGDPDGAIAELHEALRLNPNNDLFHVGLGLALKQKGDVEGAIAEYREALRVNPKSIGGHGNLGDALMGKGDLDGAIKEFREVLRVNPNFDRAHNALGIALGRKGDTDGAIAEFREALRINPQYDTAQGNLGAALRRKGDLDGAIVQYREALRMNPKNFASHYGLGVVLEQKGDRAAALAEYREAYTLNPRNSDYKNAYERLLQQVRK